MKNKIFLLLTNLILMFFAATYAYALEVEKMNVICDVADIKMMAGGDIYSQTFVSETDTFGFVSVQFSNYDNQSDDRVIFRIKEEGEKDWFNEQSYGFDRFENNSFFTFAFYPITQALGKTYVFEIETLRGPDTVPVGIFLSGNDCRESGQAFLNNEPIDRDIIFKIYTGESAIDRFTQDVRNNLASDPAFFVLWGMLLFAVFVVFLKNGKIK